MTTQTQVKKWAVAAGLTSVPLAVLLITFLMTTGAIHLISWTPDYACASCYVEVNFTALKNDTWSKGTYWNLALDGQAEMTKGQFREIGKSWQDFNLSKASKKVIAGKNYSVGFFVKKSPYNRVKWSFGTLDPVLEELVNNVTKTSEYVEFVPNIKTKQTFTNAQFESYLSIAKRKVFGDVSFTPLRCRNYTETRNISVFVQQFLGWSNETLGNGTQVSTPLVDSEWSPTAVQSQVYDCRPFPPYELEPNDRIRIMVSPHYFEKLPSGRWGFEVEDTISLGGSVLPNLTSWNDSWGYRENITIFFYENMTNYPIVLNFSFPNFRVANCSKELRLVNSTDNGLVGKYRLNSIVTNLTSGSCIGASVQTEVNGTEGGNLTLWIYYNSTISTGQTEATSWNVTNLTYIGAWGSASPYTGGFPSIDMGNFDGDAAIEIGGLRSERDNIRATSVIWSGGALTTDGNVEIKTGSYEYAQNYPAVVVDLDEDGLKEYAGGTNSWGGVRYEPRYYVINGSFNNKDLTYLETGVAGVAIPLACDFGLDGKMNICGLSAMNTNSKLHFFYGQNLSDIITAITLPTSGSTSEGGICLLDTEGNGTKNVVGVTIRNATGTGAIWMGQYWLKNGTAIRNGSFSKSWTPNSQVIPMGCEGYDHDLDGKEDMLVSFSAYSGSYWAETNAMLFNKTFANVSWLHAYTCGGTTHCHGFYPRLANITPYGQIIAAQQYYSGAVDFLYFYNPRGDLTWRAVKQITGWGFIASGYDVNGDGFNDVVAGGGDGDDRLHMWSSPKYNLTWGAEETGTPPVTATLLVYFGTNLPDSNERENTSATFDCRGTFSGTPSWCGIYTNSTGTWGLNTTNTSVYNNSWTNLTIDNLPQGKTKWACWCNASDLAAGNFTATNRTFTVGFVDVNLTLSGGISALDFNWTKGIYERVNCTGQTNALACLNMTNNGTISGNVTCLMTPTISGLNLTSSASNTFSPAVNLTASHKHLNKTLAAGASTGIWLQEIHNSSFDGNSAEYEIECNLTTAGWG